MPKKRFTDFKPDSSSESKEQLQVKILKDLHDGEMAKVFAFLNAHKEVREFGSWVVEEYLSGRLK